MALRDQPYITLYVQDYLSDENLSKCSLAAQGAYMRILCVLHKSETYGGILFGNLFKQNLDASRYFATVLAKQTGIEIREISQIIDELLFYRVLKVGEKDGVPFLYQSRMIRDSELSIKRSQSAKKGGGNPALSSKNAKNLFKQNNKQGDKLNTEDENDNENEDEKEKEGGSGEEKTKIDFSAVIDLFHRCCPGFPKVTKLTESRKGKIRVRLGEMGGMELAEAVFRKMAASKFLNGDNDRGWKATFDWVMENDKNWVKVSEGQYDDRKTNDSGGLGAVQGGFGEKVYTGTL